MLAGLLRLSPWIGDGDGEVELCSQIRIEESIVSTSGDKGCPVASACHSAISGEIVECTATELNCSGPEFVVQNGKSVEAFESFFSMLEATATAGMCMPVQTNSSGPKDGCETLLWRPS